MDIYSSENDQEFQLIETLVRSFGQFQTYVENWIEVFLKVYSLYCCVISLP